MTHNAHYQNPETGWAECDCCCGWALDRERDRKDHEAEVKVLRDALDEAAQSLTTISKMAGKGDEELMYMDQVRGYANSRARVASRALGTLASAQKEG